MAFLSDNVEEALTIVEIFYGEAGCVVGQEEHSEMLEGGLRNECRCNL